MEPSINFKNRINELIEDCDMTKSNFAKAVGVNNSAISYATIYGIIPRVSTLIKIADYFDVSLDYLLGNTDKNDFISSASPTTFQNRLTQLTEERNTTFSKIANSMPFARNLFHEWVLRNNFPTLENLYIVADYFKVSPDYLLGRTDYRNN